MSVPKVVQKMVGSDNFANFCGIKIVESRDGYAKTEVCIEENHINGMGVVQGGLIFTLADTAVAACAAFAGQTCYVIQSGITFIKATKEGKLIAECKRVVPHHRIENFIVEIKNSENEIVGTVSAIVYKKDYIMDENGNIKKIEYKKGK
ncbi:MAG: PaaI family thioesterase [Methanosarcinaceae archaeon]|nr:PaaI family thioesterase [Methanosarcinaceae archaeon]